jgi:HSP20 family protein
MTILVPFFAVNRRAPLGATFDTVLNEVFRRPLAAAAVRAIPFDVVRQGDAYVVTADLPGFRKEDIAIEIDGARVDIRAERKDEAKPADGERVLYSERRAGRAVRSFELGEEVDAERASARFADGVLMLTLPKKITETRKLLTVQ